MVVYIGKFSLTCSLRVNFKWKQEVVKVCFHVMCFPGVGAVLHVDHQQQLQLHPQQEQHHYRPPAAQPALSQTQWTTVTAPGPWH